MKKISLFVIAVLFSFYAHSQIDLKVGFTNNIAMGEMTGHYKNGPGVDINVKYLLANKLGIGISTGFQHFNYNDWGSLYSDIVFNIIPIRASFTYYFWKHGFRPYIGCELGLNLTDLKYTYYYYDIYSGFNTIYKRDYPHSRFGIAPVLGFQIDLGHTFALDINSKLNYINAVDNDPRQTAKYFGITLGLVYKFRCADKSVVKP